MKPTRLVLMLALPATALFGVYWAVCAQEGTPLFGPPIVLSPEQAEKKAAPKFPHKTQPLRDKAKTDKVDVPATPPGGRPGFVTEELPAIVSGQGATAPLPLVPIPEVKGDKGPTAPSPLPIVDIQLPVAPLPLPEPSKPLIDQPKEPAPKKSAAALELPLVIPEPKPGPMPMPLPAVEIPAKAPEPVERLRAFVRIKPDVQPVSPGPVLDPLKFDLSRPDLDIKLSSQPLAQPGLSGVATVQTPSVTVEKRGNGRLRADTAEAYHIVIRNLGPGSADLRIEDELPANTKILHAEPMPSVSGTKAVWTISQVASGRELSLKLTLQASADADAAGRLTAQVAASSATASTSLRPRLDLTPMSIQVIGPSQVALGKSAVFEIRVANQSMQPMTGIVLHGNLPEGFNTPQGRAIEGEVDVTIQPGETKTLKMPAEAVKPGHWSVAIRVTTQGGLEAAANAQVDVITASLHVQLPAATRLYMGRDSELKIDVANHSDRPMRNVTVANRLPDGIDFVDANARGLYQANSRVVYWVIDQLPAGQMQTLIVRVNGAKAGHHQNIVVAKAEGVPETQSGSVVAMEGVADLTLRVHERDNPLELGRETVYEVRVQNTGTLSADNVQLQAHFPPGLTPKGAQGKSRHSLDRQSVIFEPVASLAPGSELVFRVTALAHAVGDQRVRFALASEQVRVPIQREINVKIYADRAP